MDNDDALVALGNEAQDLLDNQSFNKVIDSLVDECFQMIGNTQPSQTEKREQSYFLYKAMVEIVNTLHQRVAVRDEIIAKRDSEISDSIGE